MRRAVVTLGHPQHAGMLRALKVLEDAAPRHGWELHYVLAGAHPLLQAVGLARERVTYLPELRRWRQWGARLRLPATVLRLARLARGADLLYACTLSSFPYCALAGRLIGCPQVVHVYSSYGDGEPYRKHLLAWARHVIAPSADSLALAGGAIGGFAPGTRTRVAYNGMDVARITDQAADPPPPELMPRGAPRIGMVGNLDARKSPTSLVAAAAAVREAVADLEVLLIGAFQEPGYEAQVRADIERRRLGTVVRVTGFLPNPFPLVRTLDVLAHPALRDPFPLSLLEGMALARPIVASAVGGIPEMLVDGESGILVPPDDPARLASALVDLLRDRDKRARLGAAAHARLVHEFSLERFAATMFTAFDEAAQAGVH